MCFCLVKKVLIYSQVLKKVVPESMNMTLRQIAVLIENLMKKSVVED